MNRIPSLLLSAVLVLVLTRCETMETGTGGGSSETITVTGTLFYPDESDTTFIVPAGAQVIGAGGRNCRYIVQEGGSLTAHAGEGNTFRIHSGGQFRGFAHPATQCTVKFESGAIIEREQTGPGTTFQPL